MIHTTFSNAPRAPPRRADWSPWSRRSTSRRRRGRPGRSGCARRRRCASSWTATGGMPPRGPGRRPRARWRRRAVPAGCPALQVGQGAQLRSTRAPLCTNARSASTSSTSPTIDTAGVPRVKATRPGTLFDDLGVEHELLGRRVLLVVDARDLGLVVDRTLWPGDTQRAVPVDVVGGDVEADRGERGGGICCCQCSWKLLSSTGEDLVGFRGGRPRGSGSRHCRPRWPACQRAASARAS